VQVIGLHTDGNFKLYAFKLSRKSTDEDAVHRFLGLQFAFVPQNDWSKVKDAVATLVCLSDCLPAQRLVSEAILRVEIATRSRATA